MTYRRRTESRLLTADYLQQQNMIVISRPLVTRGEERVQSSAVVSMSVSMSTVFPLIERSQ